MRHLFKFILILISTNCLAQELNFNIKDNKISEYINVEKKAGANILFSSSNNKKSIGENAILKFSKSELSTNDYESIYAYNKLDSSITSIRFRWKIEYPNSLLSDDNKTIQQLFKQKHFEIKSSIVKKFGKGLDDSIQEDYVGSSDLGQIKRGLNETLVWEVDSDIKLQLDTEIASLYEKGELSNYSGKFEIVVDIINNAKNENPLPKKVLDTRLINFFKSIEGDEITKSKEYLSPYLDEIEKTKLIESTILKTGKNVKLKPIKVNEKKLDIVEYRISHPSFGHKYGYIKPKRKEKNLYVRFDRIGKILSLYEVRAKK